MLSAVCCSTLHAADNKPVADKLPQPLTLQDALRYADQNHPDLAVAESEIERAKAERERLEADNGLKTSILARARYVEPNDRTPIQEHNDSALSLVARKKLYDFGRSEAALASADANIQGTEYAYTAVQNRRKLTIMSRFFDVLLADMDFLRDNEALAVSFNLFDRRRKRKELGQATNEEVLKLEAAFQKVRLERAESEARQRATRARLALAMNVPDSLPDSVQVPELPIVERKRPAFEAILKQALDSNPQVKYARAGLLAAREKLRAARAGNNPVLFGEALAQQTARELGGNDNAQIGVTLEIPLTDGGTVKADVAKQLSEVHRWEAELQRTQYSIREQALSLWLELDRLRIERERASKQLEYTDAALDRRRTEYDLELRTDLGNAMTDITGAQRDLAGAKFATALTWAKLEALMGKPINITQLPQQVKP